MRCVVGAGLLVLVGCNQVFGLHETEPYDAAPDVNAADPTVKLTWRVANVQASGAPDAPSDEPITPHPAVRYRKPGDPMWTATTYRDDGSVPVDGSLFEAPRPTWRFEYTLPDGVAHEVQWSPEDKHGQIAVPRFAPSGRAMLPATAGYDVTPQPGPTLDFQAPRVFTTGVWSEGLVGDHPGKSIRYDFQSAVWMSDVAAAPDASKGDQAFVLDYVTDGDTCRHAVGAAPLKPATVQAGHSAPAAAWEDASTSKVTLGTLDPQGDDVARFDATIGTPLGGAAALGTFSLGYLASAAMPGLPGVPHASRLTLASALPMPVMVTVLQCKYSLLTAMAFSDKIVAQPPRLAGFPRALEVELYSSRTVDGIALVSGMSSVVLATDSFAGLTPRFVAASPVAVKLETGATILDLIGGADGVAFGARGPATLRITPETGAGVRVDYYDVILHKVDRANAALSTERIYTITAPELVIDAEQLAAGSDYILEIRSYAGHPQAITGDFRAVAYPYGSVVFFTRKFHVS